MPVFTRRAAIQAPPDRVFGILLAVEDWPRWTASVSAVERLTPGPLAVGSRVRIKQPSLLPAEWVVTELVPGRSFTWVSTTPGMRAVGVHEVAPVSGGASQVTLSVRFEGPLSWFVGKLFGPLTERYIELEAAGLKARAEMMEST